MTTQICDSCGLRHGPRCNAYDGRPGLNFDDDTPAPPRTAEDPITARLRDDATALMLRASTAERQREMLRDALADLRDVRLSADVTRVRAAYQAADAALAQIPDRGERP
jgi:hypothetical protein